MPIHLTTVYTIYTIYKTEQISGRVLFIKTDMRKKKI